MTDDRWGRRTTQQARTGSLSGIDNCPEELIVEQVPGGFILVRRGKRKALYHVNAPAAEVQANLAIQGLLKRCSLGCIAYCVLSESN